MKIKNLILCTLVSLIAIGFSSCKKDTINSTNDEIATTIELSGNAAVTENITEDANDILMETAVDNNFSGNSVVNLTQPLNILGCATVTVTPLEGFPKTVAIDFGSGCTSLNGVVRKGKITVTVSDSLRKSGSIAVMNFENYYVDGFKKEGTITWTNTYYSGVRSWQRKSENGKITARSGRYWRHSGIKDIAQVEGADTRHNLLDDVYTIPGTHTVTNAAGDTRNSIILE